jgi:ribonuclease J
MNLNLYGHDGKWLMIDCGVTFNEPLTPPYRQEGEAIGHRFDVVGPDPDFIAKQRDNLAGMIITHGHEDHVGAVAYLWPRLRCTVYTTPFTAEILRRKLAQVGLEHKVPVVVISPGTVHAVGPFTLHWLPITHSIPEPQAILISTLVGEVLHTADWKIDAQPITGKPFQPQLYKQLKEKRLLALVGDSTNATKPGFSVSERACYEGLLQVIKGCEKRVVVGCFGSNVARLISLARIADKTGRYLALMGRSLKNMYSIAKQTGFWPPELTVVDETHVGYLLAQEVLIVATGSQGESRAAINRLAIDANPHLMLESGDTVVFSSIVIPGNEVAVAALIQRLEKKGIKIIASEHTQLPIHASGHPCAEEVKLLYQWVKPEIAIPVHGESKHLLAHAELAKSVGIRKTYVGLNGDLIKLAPQSSIHRGVVKVGRLPFQQ